MRTKNLAKASRRGSSPVVSLAFLLSAIAAEVASAQDGWALNGEPGGGGGDGPLLTLVQFVVAIPAIFAAMYLHDRWGWWGIFGAIAAFLFAAYVAGVVWRAI